MLAHVHWNEMEKLCVIAIEDILVDAARNARLVILEILCHQEDAILLLAYPLAILMEPNVSSVVDANVKQVSLDHIATSVKLEHII